MILKAATLVKLGNQESAKATVHQALRIDPENAKSHAMYGWLLAELKQYKEAIPHFEESLRIDPENVGIQTIFEGLSTYQEAPSRSGKAPRLNPQLQPPARPKMQARSSGKGSILFAIVAIVGGVFLVIFVNPPSWVIAIFLGILIAIWSYSGQNRS